MGKYTPPHSNQHTAGPIEQWGHWHSMASSVMVKQWCNYNQYERLQEVQDFLVGSLANYKTQGFRTKTLSSRLALVWFRRVSLIWCSMCKYHIARVERIGLKAGGCHKVSNVIILGTLHTHTILSTHTRTHTHSRQRQKKRRIYLQVSIHNHTQ